MSESLQGESENIFRKISNAGRALAYSEFYQNCLVCLVYANLEDDTTRRKRVRNRWYKTVTLVNNPTLVFERLVKRYQEMELAGDDEHERLRIKVKKSCVYKLLVLRL